MFLFLFLFFSMLLLICSFFRLKELFQVKNGLTTSLENAKIWVGQMTLQGEKKEDGLKDKKYYFRETC